MNANFYRPPPPPPPPAAKRPDPLVALSRPVALTPEPPTQGAAPNVEQAVPVEQSAPPMEQPAAMEQPAPAIEVLGESAGVLPARPPIDVLGESAGVLPAYPPIDECPTVSPGESSDSDANATLQLRPIVAIEVLGESAGVLPARPPIEVLGESAGVLPARPPILPSMPPATHPSTTWVWVLVACFAGLFGLGVLGAGVGFYIYRAHQAAKVFVAEETTRQGSEGSEGSESAPEPQPTQVAAPPPTIDVLGESAGVLPARPPVVPSPSAAASSSAAAMPRPVAHRNSLPQVQAHAPGASGSSGVIRTFAAGSGKAVFVDGHLAGTGPGPLKTTCGPHSIVVGQGKAKTFNVPCDGSTITVGSPDGT